jgi:hypothetical protein
MHCTEAESLERLLSIAPLGAEISRNPKSF